MVKKNDKNPLHKVNWYADKYQSVVVQRNLLILFTLLSLIGITLMTLASFQIVPLKSVEPFVVRIDESEGATKVVESKSLREYTANEALIKHFANTYIQARESYNFYTFKTNNNIVRVMSDTPVYRLFLASISADSPENPVKIYGEGTEKKVYTLNLPITRAATNPKGETELIGDIYVQEISVNRQPIVYKKKIYIVCTFDPDFVPDQNDRIVNPLGFKVLSYQSEKFLIETKQ